MNQPTHIIDPDGEVMVVLRNANASFASLDEETIGDIHPHGLSGQRNGVHSDNEDTEIPESCMESFRSTPKRKKKKRSKKSTSRSIPLDYFDPNPAPIEEPAEWPVDEPTEAAVEAATEESAEVPADASTEDPVEGPVEGPVEVPADEPVEESIEEPVEEPIDTPPFDEQPDGVLTGTHEGPIREANDGQDAAQQGDNDNDLAERSFCIQVSAKHLTFSSPVFKRILTGGWKESVTLLEKGSVEVIAESWDIHALLILLRVIHCRNENIPRKLTLEMLAKIAVLSDYYECKEALAFTSDIWISALEEGVPTTFSRELILWLWISWFFRLPTQFEIATSTAMSLSNGWIHSLELPLPNKVLSKSCPLFFFKTLSGL